MSGTESSCDDNMSIPIWVYKGSILWFILALNQQLFSYAVGEKNIYFDKYAHCERIKPFDLTSDDFTLISKGGSVYGYGFLRCKMTLKAPTESGICLYFDTFYIEDCGVELRIYGGPTNTGPPAIILKCNDEKPSTLCTEGLYTTLELVKEEIHPEKEYSFKINVKKESADSMEERKATKTFVQIAVIAATAVGGIFFLVMIACTVYCCLKRTNWQGGRQRTISVTEQALLEDRMRTDSVLSSEGYLKYLRQQSLCSQSESHGLSPLHAEDTVSISTQTEPVHDTGQKKRSVSFSISEM